MGQSLARNGIHLTFSTKHRAALLGPKLRPDLHEYLGGIFRDWESPSILVGGVADHIHALFSLSKNHSLAKIVKEVKHGSSVWLKTKSPRLAEFHWQAGYAAFSVSASNVRRVTAYIERQEEHHRRRTFEEELRELLKKHEVEFDERYIWD